MKLEMIESGIAKMVVSGDEMNKSGEWWMRLAVKLNPFDRRN